MIIAERACAIAVSVCGASEERAGVAVWLLVREMLALRAGAPRP